MNRKLFAVSVDQLCVSNADDGQNFKQRYKRVIQTIIQNIPNDLQIQNRVYQFPCEETWEIKWDPRLTVYYASCLGEIDRVTLCVQLGITLVKICSDLGIF